MFILRGGHGFKSLLKSNKNSSSYLVNYPKLLVANTAPICIRSNANKTAKESNLPASHTSQPLPTTVGGGSSISYVEDMYRNWRQDPTCVHTVCYNRFGELVHS